jgi:ribosomal protein RSM22 (predicted rRNA methylase)
MHDSTGNEKQKAVCALPYTFSSGYDYLVNYPVQLEQWWVDEARRVSGLTDLRKCLDAWVPDVEQLSNTFTVERSPGLGGYTREERPLVAYGLFFFPQNFVRTGCLLDEWTTFRHSPTIANADSLDVLDLGCGLGAASFAVLTHFATQFPRIKIALHAVDPSPPSLNLMQRLFDSMHERWPNASLKTVPGNLADTNNMEGTYDLIVVSFALNEAFEATDDLGRQAWLESALAKLKPPGTLLIIEPAGDETSPRLESLRDWVAEKGMARILAPCLHAGPCPLLRKGDAWCHEVRRWRVPESIEYLNRTMHRTVHDIKCSFLMLGGPEMPATPEQSGLFRLVAPIHKIPGRLVTTGCAADGKMHNYELLTRSLSHPQKQELMQLERGDIVRHGESQTVGATETLRVSDLTLVFHPYRRASNATGSEKTNDRTNPHPDMRRINIKHDPTEPLTDAEWPEKD